VPPVRLFAYLPVSGIKLKRPPARLPVAHASWVHSVNFQSRLCLVCSGSDARITLPDYVYLLRSRTHSKRHGVEIPILGGDLAPGLRLITVRPGGS